MESWECVKDLENKKVIARANMEASIMGIESDGTLLENFELYVKASDALWDELLRIASDCSVCDSVQRDKEKTAQYPDESHFAHGEYSETGFETPES